MQHFYTRLQHTVHLFIRVSSLVPQRGVPSWEPPLQSELRPSRAWHEPGWSSAPPLPSAPRLYFAAGAALRRALDTEEPGRTSWGRLPQHTHASSQVERCKEEKVEVGAQGEHLQGIEGCQPPDTGNPQERPGEHRGGLGQQRKWPRRPRLRHLASDWPVARAGPREVAGPTDDPCCGPSSYSWGCGVVAPPGFGVGMICCWWHMVDPEELAEGWEQGTEELFPTVRDELPGHAIPGDPNPDEGLCDGGGGDVHQRLTLDLSTNVSR